MASLIMLKNITVFFIYFDFFVTTKFLYLFHIVPVLFHSFDGFTIMLKCGKITQKERVSDPKLLISSELYNIWSKTKNMQMPQFQNLINDISYILEVCSIPYMYESFQSCFHCLGNHHKRKLHTAWRSYWRRSA